jgi:hypothetical protein
MNRIVLLGFAALLMTGAMAGAQPAGTVELAAIFAAETPDCAADVAGVPAPLFVQEPYWTCGSCSVSACQGLGPGSYCGKNASGVNKYCQAGAACAGQTELDRRCFCLAIGG